MHDREGVDVILRSTSTAVQIFLMELSEFSCGCLVVHTKANHHDIALAGLLMLSQTPRATSSPLQQKQHIQIAASG